jgi:hypothetical protein
VSSYDYLTSTGMVPLGNVVAALSGALLGVQQSLLYMSAVAVVVALIVVAIPSVRRLPRASTVARPVQPDPASQPQRA